MNVQDQISRSKYWEYPILGAGGHGISVGTEFILSFMPFYVLLAVLWPEGLLYFIFFVFFLYFFDFHAD